MTETVYTAVSELAETSGHHVSVIGVLNIYRIKEDIIDIYNNSYQNYGAPKITKLLRKNGEIISERTVGKYMSSIGIKAQWVKPYTQTTVNPDFISALKIHSERAVQYPKAKRRMVQRHHIHLDRGRLHLSYKHNGPLFKKDHCMDSVRYS